MASKRRKRYREDKAFREKLIHQGEGYRNRNKEAVRLCHKKGRLRAYGLTVEDFDHLLEAQGGKCAICRSGASGGKTRKGLAWNIDHDHKTGKVRGLLCQKCNLGIGCLRESVKILRAAADYLEKEPLDASEDTSPAVSGTIPDCPGQRSPPRPSGEPVLA